MVCNVSNFTTASEEAPPLPPLVVNFVTPFFPTYFTYEKYGSLVELTLARKEALFVGSGTNKIPFLKLKNQFPPPLFGKISRFISSSE